MSPAAWRVNCPGCERETDIADHDWCENFNGVFEVMDAARFPVCEYCGIQFEIEPVTAPRRAAPTAAGWGKRATP
jgi:hypothetical protein